MEYAVFIGGIIGVLVMLKILAWPLKKVFKILLNIAIGITLLFGFNFLGTKTFGFEIPINWITAIATGMLGIPGFIGVLIYCLIF